jgi:hypothetical protein
MVSLANRRSNLILVTLTLVAALAMAAPARATPLYSITDLGPNSDPDPSLRNTPTVDPTMYVPLAISNSGQVSNSPTNASVNSSWGFVSGAYGVENRALSPATNDYSWGAYLQTAGQEELIMPPGAATSAGRGVSSSGDVVGYSNSPTMLNFVYSFASKAFLTLNLNNLQAAPPIAGIYYSAFNYYDINAQNQVVGSYDYGNQGKWSQIDHAFIASLTPRALGYGGLDLNTLLPPNSGWILTSATGINDAGQIVGYGIDPSGVYSGYELTPDSNQVPEPSVLAFFGLVGLCLGARELTRHRRRDRKVAVES